MKNKNKFTKKKNISIKAVDLFCGAGGLTCGLNGSGVEVVAGFDIDLSCKFAFEHNNNAKFFERDINEIKSNEIQSLLVGGDYSLLAGCAPCQPFSTYNRAIKKRVGTSDKRWNLLDSFRKIVEEVRPDFVTMENVPGLLDQQVFRKFVTSMVNNGYSLDFKVIYCPDYGLPQKRKRLVLVGSKHGLIKLPKPTHSSDKYTTVRDTIKHLPAILAGSQDDFDSLHRSSALSPLNLERIKASKPGGSWHDWPEGLRATCHGKASGQNYVSVYGRMLWDEPAPTITTQCNGYGNGRFGHPDQDRAISLREAALLQGFPHSYSFFPKSEVYAISSVARMIGNAVPVKLGEIVGASVFESLEN